jgi:nucleotide-binding universal stress UspA family protein
MLKDIVIGVDGSEGAATALRWGVEEAALHDTKATALLAWSFLDQHHPDPRSTAFEPDYDDDDARAALASWVRTTLGHEGEVNLEVVCDLAAHALLERAEHADLVVVGARGTGGFEGLLVGSVTDRLSERATGPVAVVRAVAPVRGARVVVGVDGSARSLAALRWAATEAKARDAELEVVHAWHLPAVTAGPWVTVAPRPDELAGWAHDVLNRALADPSLVGVRATGHTTHGGAAGVLLDRAKGAGLVVVGSRGHGAVAGWLLGSVSRQLVHHAPCPVIVI